jgi:formylglycine-generating enzyme required for sulfatase activity
VEPAGATRRTIAWSVKDAGATGALIDGSALKTDAPGTVVVIASVAEGLADSEDYTEEFTITVQPGLAAAIGAASAAKTGVAVSADGSDVPAESYWVSQADLDALNTAIDAAETTAQNLAASQAEKTAAASALVEATEAFNQAKQNGTKAAANKTALNEAIAAANAAKTGVAASADGSDVPESGYWASQAAFDDLNAAIGAAQMVSQDPAADQTGVDAAVSALTTATEVFNTAKQPGTKSSVADKTALAAAIGTANAAKTGVAVSADGSDVPMDLYWASQAAFDTLTTAIGAAETTAQDLAAEQAEVEAAASALTSAVNAFKTTARRGTKPVRTVSANGVSFDLRLVDPPGPGGFKWGSGTANVATISKGYWVGETEVTQELFEAVMGVNPSYFTAAGEAVARRPVESVSWYAAIAFCNKLSLLDGKTPVYSVSVGGREVDWANLAYTGIPGPTSGFADKEWNDAVRRIGNGYRLPYDMEWMWAAMGGNDGGPTVTTNGYAKPFAGSNGTNSMDDYAWHSGNAAVTTHEVKKKRPNELGLYDMTGNVAEWCQEQEGYTIFARHSANTPACIFRGGSWSYATKSYAVGNRGEDAHDHPSLRFTHVGFRVACDK